MTKILKRPLSILLAVLMVMSVFIAVPMTASATDYALNWDVDASDLQVGDSLGYDIWVNNTYDNDYTFILKGGTYGLFQGGEFKGVQNNDYSDTKFRTSSGEEFDYDSTPENAYVPVDANGHRHYKWYVKAIDGYVITLGGPGSDYDPNLSFAEVDPNVADPNDIITCTEYEAKSYIVNNWSTLFNDSNPECTTHFVFIDGIDRELKNVELSGFAHKSEVADAHVQGDDWDYLKEYYNDEGHKIYICTEAPAGNTLKASDLSTGDTIGTDFTSFDPEDYTFVLKGNRYCGGIGYDPDVEDWTISFTAADDNFTLKVIDGTLVAFYDWGDDPGTYRFADRNGDVTNTAYVLAVYADKKQIVLGGYEGDYYLYESLTENTAEITKYDGSAAELTIPSEIDGYTITAIGESAFEESLCTSIEIPNTVTSIEQLAFVESDNLESITIPASVTSIGYAAFADCNAMETVTFVRPSAQQNLTIGSQAFSWNNATLSYSGSGDYALYNGDNEIAANSAVSNLNNVTLTWKTPAAAPTYDYTTEGNDGYNFNDTITKGDGDTLATLNGYSSLFNFKILGVQKKDDVDVLSSSSGKDVRFVSVVNTDILKDADEYGYVFAKFDTKEQARDNVNNDDFTAHSSKVLTKVCTKTSNTISGDYGLYNEDTNYKYVTATVNGIGDDTVAARFYVRKGSTYYYADYTNDQNQTYGVCAAAYSDLT